MTWTLNATGRCATEEDERKLVAELSKALSAESAGTVASGFNGQSHRGPAHGMPEKPSGRRSAPKGAEE